MNRKLILSAICALALSPAFAQDSNVEETVEISSDKYKVETNRFWSNWFIGVGGGAQVYFGDHDKQCDLKDRLAPALDVYLGKWFTPGIGVRLAYSGLSVKGATKIEGSTEPHAHGTGEPVPGKDGAGYYLQKQKFDMFNIHGDVLFNVSNLLCGYNPKRFWNCSPYIGLGWGRVWEAPQQKELTGNFGLFNAFRVCDAIDINLDLRAMYIADRFDGEDGGRFGEGMLSATVGVAYKFPKRGWDRSKTITRFNNAELNELRELLAQRDSEIADLRNRLANVVKTDAANDTAYLVSACLVTFPINKTKLSNEARVNLGMLAEVIKAGPKSAVYSVVGYADKGTGSTAVNERLSEQRAEAVRKCLVEEYGVNASQLRVSHKGGVDNMFYDDPRMSRAVITRAE